MKVVLCGSAGIGKTTLAVALARRFCCPTIAEQYDTLFGKDYNYVRPAARLQRKIFALLEAKHAQEEAVPHCFSDRGPVDLFNLWMTEGLGLDRKLTAEFYHRCRTYIDKYDHVVVLPWGAIPLRQIGGASLRRRSMNIWFQLHNHASVIGLLQQWVKPEKLLPVPFEVVDLNDRVAFVAGHLKQRVSGDRCEA